MKKLHETTANHVDDLHLVTTFEQHASRTIKRVPLSRAGPVTLLLKDDSRILLVAAAINLWARPASLRRGMSEGRDASTPQGGSLRAPSCCAQHDRDFALLLLLAVVQHGRDGDGHLFDDEAADKICKTRDVAVGAPAF